MDAFQKKRRGMREMPLQAFFCSAQIQHWSIRVFIFALRLLYS